MKSYVATPDCIMVEEDQSVELKKHTDILGYSIDVPADSLSDADVQINGGPKIRFTAGGASRSFGGFMAGDNPVTYRDKITVTFVTPAAATKRCLIVLTHINCD